MKPDTCAIVKACGSPGTAGTALDGDATDEQTAALGVYVAALTAADAGVGKCEDVAVAEGETVTQ